MALTIQLYWSFRSPYSYLATSRIVAMVNTYDLEIDVKIVTPLAVRDPDFFKRNDPKWMPYLLMDIVRVAQMNHIDIGPPNPDPIVQDIATLSIAKEQPYIFRLCRLGVEANRLGHGLPFIDEVSKLIWSGKVQGWNEGDHLAQAATRAGCDLARMEQTIAADVAKYDAILEQNLADLEAAGHWGVPTLVFNGEPFWGQDRLDVLLWRLQQHGLKKR